MWDQQLSTGSDFAPGYICQCLEVFSVATSGILLLHLMDRGARDVNKHAAMQQRNASHGREADKYLAQKIMIAEVWETV